jgi:hypothetical protein
MEGAIAQPSAAPICAESVRGDLNSALISVRVSDQGSVLVATKSSKGNVTECRIVKPGSSYRTDAAACAWVKDHWRSLERCQAH